LQESISLQRNQELVGRVEEIMVEGDGRKGNLRGRTRTNKLVHVSGDLPAGAFTHARVTAAAPHHLTGELGTAGAWSRSGWWGRRPPARPGPRRPWARPAARSMRRATPA